MAVKAAVHGAASPVIAQEQHQSLLQLFGLVKTGAAADEKELQKYLVTVSQQVKSFNVFGYKLEDLEETSKQLVKLKIGDIVDFVNSDLFDKEPPVWKPETSPRARAAALHLYNFLIEAKKEIIKMDVVTEAASPSKRRNDDSPDVRRKRKKKRHHSNSSSSSSSSERERIRADDATAIIEQSDFKVFGLESFPRAKLVNAVVKHRLKNGEERHAYLSTLPIEDWVPSYVGFGKSSTQQKKLLKDRQTSSYMSADQVIAHATSFWITHGLNDSVKVGSVIRFVMIITKLCNDKGSRHATQYFRCLIQHIKEQVLKSSVKIKEFDSYINTMIPEAETSCNILMQNSQGTRLYKKEEPSNPTAGTPPVPAVRPNNDDKDRHRPKDTSKRICRFHHPAHGMTCRRGKDCPDRHVNTSTRQGLKDYEDVFKNTSKHNGKGQNRR